MINYKIVLTNITGGFFTSNFINEFNIEKDVNSELKGSIVLSSQVYVKNLPIRNNTVNKFIEPISLSSLDINGNIIESAAITKMLPKVVRRTKIDLNEFDLNENVYEYDVQELRNESTLEIKELIGVSSRLNTYSSLLNMFKIGDYLLLEAYKFEPNVKNLEEITRVYVYVKNIIISDGQFTLEVEGETWKLKRTPVSISTPIKGKNILDFLEQYIIWYLIKFTSIRSVVIRESDFNIFKASNFGGYRSNVVNLYKIVETLNKDYNINIDFQGVGQCVISYGQIDRIPNKRKTKVINVIDGIYEYDLNNVNPTDNPIIVRCSSTSQTRDIAENKRGGVTEVIWGDLEALSNSGTIQNFKTINLDKEGLTAFAKRMYSKQKYLSKTNGFFSKIPIYYSRRIYLNDNKNPYNTGWYFVNGTKLSISNDGGLICEVKLGIRFNDYDDVSKALNI